MPPREATNPFPDQYLTLDYESAGPVVLPHDDGGGNGGGGGGGGPNPAAGGDVPGTPEPPLQPQGIDPVADAQNAAMTDVDVGVGAVAGAAGQGDDGSYDPVAEAQNMEAAVAVANGATGAQTNGEGGEQQEAIADPLGVTDAAMGENNPSGGGIEIPPPAPAMATSPSHPVAMLGSSSMSMSSRGHRRRPQSAHADQVAAGGSGGEVDPLSIDPTPSPPPTSGGGGEPSWLATAASGGSHSTRRVSRSRSSGGEIGGYPQAGLPYNPVRSYPSVEMPGMGAGLPGATGVNHPHHHPQAFQSHPPPTDGPFGGSFDYHGGVGESHAHAAHQAYVGGYPYSHPPANQVTPPHHHASPPNHVVHQVSGGGMTSSIASSPSASSSVSSSTSGDSTAPLSMGSPLPSSAPVSPLMSSPAGGMNPAAAVLSGTVPATPYQGQGGSQAAAEATPPDAGRSTHRLLQAYQQGDADAVPSPPPAPHASRRYRRHHGRHHHPHAHPHQLFSSVLDNSTTMDDSDEEDEDDDAGLNELDGSHECSGSSGSQEEGDVDAVPGLDTTHASEDASVSEEDQLADDEAAGAGSFSSPQAASGSRRSHAVTDNEDAMSSQSDSSNSFYGTPASGTASAHRNAAASQAASAAAAAMSSRNRAFSDASSSTSATPNLHYSGAFDQGSPAHRRGGGARRAHHRHQRFAHGGQPRRQSTVQRGVPQVQDGNPIQVQDQFENQQGVYYQPLQQPAPQAPLQPHHPGQAYLDRHHPQLSHPPAHAHHHPVPRRNDSSGAMSAPPATDGQPSAPGQQSSIALSFDPRTATLSDLTYFAERGLIVPLLSSLDGTPRLETLGARMLADYAKMSNRRVAVASNGKILEWLCRVTVSAPLPMHLMAHNQMSGDMCVGSCSPQEWESSETGPGWPAREYAVEAVRSLTATEESDAHLMGCPGLLATLASAAAGGPFVTVRAGSGDPDSPVVGGGGMGGGRVRTAGAASPKARLHACIAVMNLSCGKSNKVAIAKVPSVLAAMRDVMVGLHFPPRETSTESGNKARDEARLKAVTCVKNLSNADANDAALLGCPGLVEALGRVALECSRGNDSDEQHNPDREKAMADRAKAMATCTTNACLALMNLSISKANKHRVFRTPGVMDALMAVITRTCPSSTSGSSPSSQSQSQSQSQAEAQAEAQARKDEARVKACSALSNLAIGYDNKIPMFAYPGFVESILRVITADDGEARTKACSILWSFAAEMKNQVPVVQRGDILPTLVSVAKSDLHTEARFKCVAALTLLAESLENAIPLLEAGALEPLMDILRSAGPDPTQWKGQTASWCVGFLMNIAQADGAVPCLREAGVVELLAPLLTLDHYQSLKAAMAVTFVCRYDEGDETYDLLRKTENVIPKIVSLLHNTLSGRGGNGYKYGVFTLRSSVGCISSLAGGPDFTKERIATRPVFDSLLLVLRDFCVDGGTDGAIVGGGRDDALSATLAMRAVQDLTAHLIPVPGSSSMPFGPEVDARLLEALECFEQCGHPEITPQTRSLATDAKVRILGNKRQQQSHKVRTNTFCQGMGDPAAEAVSAAVKHMTSRTTTTGTRSAATKAAEDEDMEDASGNESPSGPASIAASIASSCCGAGLVPGMGFDWDYDYCFPSMMGVTEASTPLPIAAAQGQASSTTPATGAQAQEGNAPEHHSRPKGLEIIDLDETSASSAASSALSSPTSVADAPSAPAASTLAPVRTFLLNDPATGRRYAVPTDPSGGRYFYDSGHYGPWCYRRGRFCKPGESPDSDYVWTVELQAAYDRAIARQRSDSGAGAGDVPASGVAMGVEGGGEVAGSTTL